MASTSSGAASGDSSPPDDEPYRRFFENAVDGLYRTSPDGRLLLANQALALLAGYASPGEMIANVKDLAAQFYVNSAERVRFQTTLQTAGIVRNFETQMRRRDGTVIWISADARTLRDEQGHVCFEGMIRDITAQKLAQEALGASESRFRTTLEFLKGGCMIFSPDWRYLYVNQVGAEHARRPREALIGQRLTDCFPGIESTLIYQAYAASMADRTARELESEFLHADGTAAWYHVNIQPVPEGLFVLTQEISARKRAELGAAYLGEIVRSSDDAIIGKNLSGIITSWNPGAEKVFGYTAAEAIGQPMLIVFPPERVDEEAEILARIARGERLHHYETVRLRKDGRRIHVSATISPIYDAAGNIIGASKIARDITLHKQQEHEIQRLTRLYAALSQINQAIVMTPERAALYTKVCEVLVTFGGFKMAWIGRLDPATLKVNPVGKWGDHSGYLDAIEITIENRPHGQGPAGTAIREGRTYLCNDSLNDPRTLPWRDEAKRADFRSSATFPISEDGAVCGALCVYSDEIGFFQDKEVALLEEAAGDVSFALDNFGREEARRKAEEALRESERFTRAVLDSLTAHIAVLDAHGNILAVNQAWRAFSTVNGAPATNSSAAENYLAVCEATTGPEAEIARQVAQGIRDVIDGRRVRFECEYPCHTPQEQLWFSVHVTRFPGPGPCRVVVAHENITQRKLHEIALLRSEDRFRVLVENIREVFWLSELDTRKILYISPAYLAIWGRTPESLYASNPCWADTVHEEDRARVSKAAETKQHLGTYDETYRVVRPDGTIRWVRARAFPVQGAHAEVTRIVGVAEDVTTERELDAKLLHTQRLEAIGTLSAGIAHDLNNILAPMLMATSLLRTELSSPQNRELIAMIETGAQRGANIIRQLLTFSRGLEGDRTAVQLRHIMSDMVAIARETFPRNITVTQDIARDLSLVSADATQLHQVLMNLCVNARDAMPHGGTLILTGRNVALNSDTLPAHPDAKPGRYACVTVADTGHGIPASLVDRIFEPFFTTKAVGKGTGLGLSTAIGIVKSHGGFVTVDSAPGRGASFSIYLPALEDFTTATSSEVGLALPRGSGQLILVVDDESSIRLVTQATLRHWNYRVESAVDGQQGLALFLQHRADVRLVLVDLMMPVMGGSKLMRKLWELEPDLKMIAMSGMVPDDQRAELHALNVHDTLMKPFQPEELLARVAQALNDPTPRS